MVIRWCQKKQNEGEKKWREEKWSELFNLLISFVPGKEIRFDEFIGILENLFFDKYYNVDEQSKDAISILHELRFEIVAYQNTDENNRRYFLKKQIIGLIFKFQMQNELKKINEKEMEG